MFATTAFHHLLVVRISQQTGAIDVYGVIYGGAHLDHSPTDFPMLVWGKVTAFGF